MADNSYAAARVAIGGADGFELTLKSADGSEQRFDLPLRDIPDLVRSLTAIAWASAATNRPPAGTVLPRVHAYPVKNCEVGTTSDANEPVMLVELFGGVTLGLHLTRDVARSTAAALAKLGGVGPTRM